MELRESLKRERKQKLILENKNLYFSILILALPIFLSNFMKAFNNLIDMFLVSNMLNTDLRYDAISAISMPGPVIDITHAIASGLMTAGAAMIAQYLGAKQKKNASRITAQLLLLCTISGVVMNIVLYLFTPMIMRSFGAEGQALQFMIDYVRYRSFEMVPLFTFFAFQASRTASGDTVTPFILNVIMIVFNIVSSYIFIKYYNMGVKGAALGTTLANVVIMPIYIYLMFQKKNKNITITLADIKPDYKEIYQLFKLSWPIAISSGITSFGFVLLNRFIYDYGRDTVNAFTIGNRINSMILMPAMGIGSITATFVGQNIGAANEKRARESVKAAMIMSVVVAIIGCFAVLPIRESVVGIFIKSNDETMKLSVQYLFFVLTGLPLMSIFQVFMGSYQGSGETKFSLIISMLRLWVIRIPMVITFKYVLQMPNSTIWYAMIFSNFAAIYIGTILYTKCKFIPRVKIDNSSLEEVI